MFSNGWDVRPSHLYTGMSLRSEDSLIVMSGRTMVDTVTWDRTFPVVSGASMTLNPTKLTARDNDAAASWCTSRVRYGSGGDLGTPRGANEACSGRSLGFRAGVQVPLP